MNKLRAIPLFPPTVAAPLPLQLGLFVRSEPDPQGDYFVRLRTLADAVVYRGCILDALGQVRQTLEIWTQTTTAAAQTFSGSAWHGLLTNAVLDQRWRKQHQLLARLDPELCLTTGLESSHPKPLGLSLPLASITPLTDSQSGLEWQLCEDDAVLLAQKLPPFSSSLERFLYLPDQTPPRFASSALAAPAATPALPTLAEIAGPDWIPLNPEGGLMLFRLEAGNRLEDYLLALCGRAASLSFGIPAGPAALEWLDPDSVPKHEPPPTLFLVESNRGGRLAEVFYLKLSLLAGMLDLVRTAVREQAAPFLNLAGESFNVYLDHTCTGLPTAWKARLKLCKPGQALALTPATGESRFFARLPEASGDDYFPQGVDQSIEGECSVRILSAKPQPDGKLLLEGTLTTHENLRRCSLNDTLTLRLAARIGRFNLPGHLQPSAGLPPRNYRFRTEPLSLPPPVRSLLSEAGGFNFPAASLEVAPVLSTPCDLYSLGMLAIRVLLTFDPQEVPAAYDALHQLAEQLQPTPELGQAAPASLDSFLKADLQTTPNGEFPWLQLLGPHHLYDGGFDPPTALQFVPLELWSETLLWILRLFPGLLPDSYTRNFGDAPPGTLEVVFDRPAEDLTRLLHRAKSLVFIDWNTNREISCAIRELLAETPDQRLPKGAVAHPQPGSPSLS